MHGRKTANENRSIYPTHYISIHIPSHPPSVKPLALFAGRLSIHLLGHIRRHTQANNTSQHGTLNPPQNTLDPPKSNLPFPYFPRMGLNKLAKDSDAQSNGGEVNDPMIVMPFYYMWLDQKDSSYLWLNHNKSCQQLQQCFVPRNRGHDQEKKENVTLLWMKFFAVRKRWVVVCRRCWQETKAVFRGFYAI